MRIAYLTHDTPDVYYRVEQYQEFLHDHGVSTSILRTPRNPLRRLKTFYLLSRFDAVVVQRKLFNLFWRMILKSKARVLIMDVDDAIMFRSDDKHPYSQTRMQRYKHMVNMCNSVIVGNSYLRDQTLRVSPALDVNIIPTVVDTQHYHVKTHDKRVPVTIGWIGSSSTIKHLEIVQAAIKEILANNPTTRFRIISNEFPSWKWAEKKVWSRESEIEDVLGLDIGIMPLLDNAWTRGKCGFKIIQYMATGLPVVVSPVGANNDIVLDGQTGFFATSHEQWVGTLQQLVDSYHLRMQLGQEGRKRAEESFSLEANAQRYLSILTGAVS